MRWKVTLCGNPRFANEFPNAPIVEVKYLGTIIKAQPRLYEDGHVEVDCYHITSMGKPGGADANHASADFVETEMSVLEHLKAGY